MENKFNQIYVTKLVQEAVIPSQGTPLAAGFDLSSCVDITVPAHGKQLVPTGLVIELPEGTYGRIAPRSGIAWNNFIDVGAGTVDSDYRGEVKVLLFNFSDEDFVVGTG